MVLFRGMQHKEGSLSKLFNQIFKGEATTKEKEQADNWFNQLDLYKEPYFSSEDEEEQIRMRMQTNMQQHIFKADRQQKIQYFPLWTRAVAAAVIIACLSFGFYTYYHASAKPEIYSLAAGNNSIKIITLPDGTTVTLNKLAKIEWDSEFNSKERRIKLFGEAFFDVKKDAAHPFVVQSANITTTVLGTAFNVESYAGEQQIKVSLVRGHVKINDQQNKDNHTELRPGQMMTYTKGINGLEVKPIAVEDPGAWVRGGIVFNDIPLSAALDRISATYHINIQYNRQQAQDKTVTASLENVSWKEALHAVLFMHDMKYILNKKGEIIIE